MAGKIVADTLEHSTAGSIATNYVVNGSAKSWISSNGTGTIAIRGSFNVSSISDVATGKILVSVTNGFDSTDNMSTSGGASNNLGASGTYITASFVGSTTSYRTHGIWGTTHYDVAYVLGQAHGELA